MVFEKPVIEGVILKPLIEDIPPSIHNNREIWQQLVCTGSAVLEDRLSSCVKTF